MASLLGAAPPRPLGRLHGGLAAPRHAAPAAGPLAQLHGYGRRSRKRKAKDGGAPRLAVKKAKAASSLPPLPPPPPPPGQGYWPTRVQDSRRRNRHRARKFFGRHAKRLAAAPAAPFNTSQFLMRSSRMGILAPVESPATPASVMLAGAATPSLWPDVSAATGGGKQLVDEARELGVDAYGSMNDCIRLREATDDCRVEETESVQRQGSPDHLSGGQAGGSSSSSTSSSGACDKSAGRSLVDSADQVERRIDHELLRFEVSLAGMAEPLGSRGASASRRDRHLRARIDEQERQVAHLEEENLTLRERVYVMEQELTGLRQRLLDAPPESVCGEGSDNNAQDLEDAL